MSREKATSGGGQPFAQLVDEDTAGPGPDLEPGRPEGHTFARRNWSISKPGLPPHPANLSDRPARSFFSDLSEAARLPQVRVRLVIFEVES